MRFHRTFVFVFLVLGTLMISCGGGAEEKKEMRRVVLPAGEVHDGWYFAAGDQVVIEGTINGDAYIAAGTVTVDGTINGDLLVAGGNVTIGGVVSDDIRAGGGSVTLLGKTGKNVTVAGGSVTIARGSVIGGNLLAGCGTLQHGGTIMKDAIVASGDASITGGIGGRARYAGGRVEVYPGASIGGDFDVMVEKAGDAVIAEGTVRGKVTVSEEQKRATPAIVGFLPWVFWAKVMWAVSLIATALALVFVFPKQLAGSGETIVREPGASLVWGLVGLITIPVAALILIVTLIGIPLGVFLIAAYLWILYLTQLALAVGAARLVVGTGGKSGWNLFLPVALGILITQALTFIPYLGTIVILGGMVFGMGAILLQIRRTRTSTKPGAAGTP